MERVASTGIYIMLSASEVVVCQLRSQGHLPNVSLSSGTDVHEALICRQFTFDDIVEVPITRVSYTSTDMPVQGTCINVKGRCGDQDVRARADVGCLEEVKLHGIY